MVPYSPAQNLPKVSASLAAFKSGPDLKISGNDASYTHTIHVWDIYLRLPQK